MASLIFAPSLSAWLVEALGEAKACKLMLKLRINVCIFGSKKYLCRAINSLLLKLYRCKPSFNTSPIAFFITASLPGGVQAQSRRLVSFSLKARSMGM